jgi:hypothetical protein
MSRQVSIRQAMALLFKVNGWIKTTMNESCLLIIVRICVTRCAVRKIERKKKQQRKSRTITADARMPIGYVQIEINTSDKFLRKITVELFKHRNSCTCDLSMFRKKHNSFVVYFLDSINNEIYMHDR